MFNLTAFKKYKHFKPLIVMGLIGVMGIGYLVYQYVSVVKQLEEFSVKNAKLEENVKTLEEDLHQAKEESARLSGLLQKEAEKNAEFQKQVESAVGTVGMLEKLSQTDKELLQKYSKVYFLNENYVPKKLSKIEEKYLYEKGRESLIHSSVEKYLYKMMDRAELNGSPLQIISAYRSFGEQAGLKAGYKTTYGSGANTFSADQGYSEHQLGTAVDFTTPKLAASFGGMESTPAYEWLQRNAHNYGFVLSYPKGNAYYQFESWHWRFVGIDLAQVLNDRDMNFYDMSQREIDTYLVNIFD